MWLGSNGVRLEGRKGIEPRDSRKDDGRERSARVDPVADVLYRKIRSRRVVGGDPWGRGSGLYAPATGE